MISNCNCTKKIECGCVLEFDYYEPESISVLSVGNLLGGDCVFEDYVIDWYRNGVRELVSGHGSDPDIEAFHPFIGLESIPVLPGEWVPIVRYVIIDGEIIYAHKKMCHTYCDDLSNLPVIIVVSPIDCESVNTASNGYSYRISYISSQDFNLAYRKFSFSLPTTYDIKFLALQFTASLVADRIDVFWNDDVIPIESVIVGSRFNSYNEALNPKRYASASIKYIIDVDGHVPGDYIRFEITPSVLEVNVNTNWTLDIKCLDDTYEFPCNAYTAEMQSIKELGLTKDVSNCRHQLRVKLGASMPKIDQTTPPMNNWSRYLGISSSISSSIFDYGNSEYLFNLSYIASYSTKGYSYGGASTLINSKGLVHYKKTGLVMVITCAHIDDYNAHKTGYNYIMTTSNYLTEYVNDNTNLAYYRRIYYNLQVTTTSCGDNYTSYGVSLHPTATIVFDDALKKITITSTTIVNGMANIPCDNSYNAANSMLGQINQFANYPDFDVYSICMNQYPFGYATSVNLTPAPSPTAYSIVAYHYKYLSIGDPCVLNLFCRSGSSNSFYACYLRVEYTGTPEIDNYEVSSYIDVSGCPMGLAVLIYKVEAGVVTVNNLPT